MSFTTVSRLTAGCALALGIGAPALAGPDAFLPKIAIAPLGTYATGVFAESAAEIVAHDPRTQRLFVVNAQSLSVDVLDIRTPSAPQLLFSVNLGGIVNSVSVHKGLIVAAVEADPKTDPGKAVFFNADGKILASVEVGALPDMATFTPDGKRVLVANEGEPSDDYEVDPEGSVSIIELPRNIRRLSQHDVRTADFKKFNDATLDPSVRVFGPNATVAQDFEPEYITVAKDSKTAWVALQENNAIAVLDIEAGTFSAVHGLGFKDHSLAGNELDASDRDGAINIVNWPILGMYLPDAIASYEHRGQTYIVTANEGDARDYDGFSEEARVKNIDLNPAVFPDAALLQADENLGRLTVTTALGVDPKTGLHDEIYAFGARSFSIWTADMEQVYDSGADFERITADAYPEFFNSNHEENSFDNRSDNKGPEPEGVAVAKLWGRTYAFIGLERIGGVMVYDVTNPYAPSFVQYLNNRDFSAEPGTPEAGDLGAEGLTVIEGWKSPIRGVPLLVVANEVSGTTTLFRIERVRR
ncbi:MAG: choice-of-anchor I family protein [Thiocapsa sp.]|uniref:choice-of-anchor I family protein n=1 Tax=Thiocapsa sp. TaxID=2024551 RepID=UPI001BCBAC08|nr:choice-of-anchor I family protein [Thiocapsa sp.]QVL47385.1 MAG: choice-of-anchor I family protein [Thiocapsa sp.]